MSSKKRCRFMIDHDIASRLEAIRFRTGLSMAEQIRRAIDVWLETDDNVDEPQPRPVAATPVSPHRRRARASGAW